LPSEIATELQSLPSRVDSTLPVRSAIIPLPRRPDIVQCQTGPDRTLTGPRLPRQLLASASAPTPSASAWPAASSPARRSAGRESCSCRLMQMHQTADLPRHRTGRHEMHLHILTGPRPTPSLPPKTKRSPASMPKCPSSAANWRPGPTSSSGGTSSCGWRCRGRLRSPPAAIGHGKTSTLAMKRSQGTRTPIPRVLGHMVKPQAGRRRTGSRSWSRRGGGCSGGADYQ
jgi:hypothetical protein